MAERALQKPGQTGQRENRVSQRAAGLPPPRLSAISPPSCPQSPLSPFWQPGSLTRATVLPLPSSLPPPLSGPLHSSPVRESPAAGSQHPPLTPCPRPTSCYPASRLTSGGVRGWSLGVSLCPWLSPATSDLSHRNTNSPPPPADPRQLPLWLMLQQWPAQR